MSELDLVTFVGLSESWHAFDESRFNISCSISAFEMFIKFEMFICAFTFYCNSTRIIFILFCWSCCWILTQYGWYLLTGDILEYLDFKLHW